uniref:Uncharacterized protein n=1 Tax=Anopheles merus TaxID=30066 RepID=A0A182V0H0_ANOME
MVAAFTKISTSMTSRIATLQAGFKVLDFPLFKQLVDTLMGNDEYGRYCYQKYKELGKGIFGQAFDSAWQCVDNEYARLEYLKTTLGLMVDLLVFDYEDVIDQVKVCDNLTSGNNLNNCVSARAVSNLSAYFPLVEYIMITSIENIAEADSLIYSYNFSYIYSLSTA